MLQLTLTPAQMDAANFTGEHVLIKGAPGSGKTTVLLMKLVKIIQDSRNSKILFITYNKTLKKYLEELLLEITKSGIDCSNVEISTYHSWAISTLRNVRVYTTTAKSDVFDNFFSNEIYNKNQKSKYISNLKFKEFLFDEIKWIKNKGFFDEGEYISVERTGRKQALQSGERKVIFDIFNKFNSYLSKRKLVIWEDYANLILKNIKKITSTSSYDYILIDEAQDLSQVQLISLRMLAKKSLVVSADMGQKIYRTDFTWKSTGINVLGGRTKSLEGTHRCTKEILSLAHSLYASDKTNETYDDLGLDKVDKKGDIPLVFQIRDSNLSEYDFVSQLIKDYQQKFSEKGKNVTIGVLNYTNDSVNKYNYVFKNKGIDSVNLAFNDAAGITNFGVKVLTMHKAKGLEFDLVIITGLNSYFPNLSGIIEEEIDEQVSIIRRLLFVSMTRAKQHLILTYKGQPSSFINELDESKYTLKLIN